MWACAPLVSGLITGVNEGMEAEPCLSDALSLWTLLGLRLPGSQAQKPTSAAGLNDRPPLS